MTSKRCFFCLKRSLVAPTTQLLTLMSPSRSMMGRDTYGRHREPWRRMGRGRPHSSLVKASTLGMLCSSRSSCSLLTAAAPLPST
ncbi:unnamed protein product, partial [Ixodes hexagonus]